MRRLILLRHAKSDWPDDIDDFDRPLAPRGLRDAPRIGRALREQGFVPDHAIVSPARRTRETFDHVAAEWPAPTHVLEPTIYEADARMIFAAIRDAPAGAGTVMVVGHNPGLETLAPALLRAEDRAPFLRGHDKFPTGATLVLDFDVDDWQAIAAGAGRLVAFLVPHELD